MFRCPHRQTLAQRLARHLAAGAVVAAAAPLCSAREAEAGIVHAVVNWTVPNTLSGLYIDVEFRVTGELDLDVPGWDINPYGTNALIWFNAPGTGMMRFPGVTTGGPGCLAVGTTVNAAASFGSGTVTVGSAAGNWSLNHTNHFGFRFIASDGLVHYGWGKFELGSTVGGADRRISEIAWETIPNRAIVVGDTGAPPPGYDPCASTNPVALVGANALAMNQTAAADLTVPSCGFTIRKANYFKFIAPMPGTYTVSACGMTADTRMAVLNGCNAGASVVACNDDACGSASSLSFASPAGGIYYIVVGGANADLPNPISLSIDPPWSTCVDPQPAVLGAQPFACIPTAGSQLVSMGPKGFSRTFYNTAWFVFVPPVTSRYRFSTCGAAGNTQLAIATQCAVSPTSMLATIAADDDGCPCATGACSDQPWASLIDDTALTDKPLTQPLIAGTPYLVVVGGFSPSDQPTGTLVIEDSSGSYNPCSPVNPAAVEGANLLAMAQTSAADLDLGACGIAHRANYFKFIPTFSGSYTVSTCASGADTALAVLDGCASGSVIRACARDTCGVGESVSFAATAGAAYYIVIGSGTASTVLPALVPVSVATPPDPACENAPPLAFGAQPFTNAASTITRLVRASVDGDSALIQKAVFYSFTPAVTGAYRFSLCGGSGDSMMALGRACANLGVRFDSIAFNDESCGHMSVLDANNGGAAGTALGGFPLTEQLVAGQTYRLVVGSFNGGETVAGSLVVSGPPQGNPADLNHDGVVDSSDIAMLLNNWGGSGVGDIDQDGVVGAQDIAMLLGAWG